MASAYQVDLEQPRSVREILVATLRMYRRYPLLFAILALAVVAPYELAFLGITGYGPLVRLARKGEGIYWLNFFLRASLITPLISALHMHAVVAIGDGRTPQLKAVAWRGLSVLPVVGAADVMAATGVLLGFIALVIPGILLWLRWAVVPQAAALEHEGPFAAMRSSRQLTVGHYWHIFGLLLIYGVLGVAVIQAARAIPLGSTSGLASVTVGIAVNTATASFIALTLALLYFDLRARARQPALTPPEHQHLRDLD